MSFLESQSLPTHENTTLTRLMRLTQSTAQSMLFKRLVHTALPSSTPTTLDTESSSGLSVCNTLNSTAFYHTFLLAVRRLSLPGLHCSTDTQFALVPNHLIQSDGLWHPSISALTSNHYSICFESFFSL